MPDAIVKAVGKVKKGLKGAEELGIDTKGSSNNKPPMKSVELGDTLFEKDGRGYTVMTKKEKSMYTPERLQDSEEGKKKFKKNPW